MDKKNKIKYINLKEAAKISGYAFDYVGYLIRKGKIFGKKIYSGSSWEVSRWSILKYIKKNNKVGFKNHFKNSYRYFIGKRYISLKEAAKISGYCPDYLGYLIRERKIIGKKIYSGVKWLTTKEAIKNYQKVKKGGKGIKKFYNFKIDISPFLNPFSKRGFYFSLRLPQYAFVLIIMCAIVFSGLVAWAFGPKNPTQIAEIYPVQIKGDWQNIQNAQGPPEVSEIGRLDLFSETNSAVYKNGALSLIADNFHQTELEKQLEESSNTGENSFNETNLEETPNVQQNEETKTEEITTTTAATTNEANLATPFQEPQELNLENGATTSEIDKIETTSAETVQPITFFNSLKNTISEGAKKIKNFFGNQAAKAQQIPSIDELTKTEFISAKIKFSLAIGEKEPDLKILEEASNPEQELLEVSRDPVSTYGATTSQQKNEERPNNTSEENAILENTSSAEEQVQLEQPTENQPSDESWPEPEILNPVENEPTGLWDKIKYFFADLRIKINTIFVKATNTLSAIFQTMFARAEDAITTSSENSLINGSDSESAGEPLAPDAKIIISYSLDGNKWEILDTISSTPLSNALNGGYFTYEAPFLKNWEDIKNLKIKFEGVVGGQTNVTAYLDSVWVEVEYQEKEEEEEFELRAIKEDWRADEEPEFEIVPKGKKEKENIIGKVIAQVSEIFEEEPRVKATLLKPDNKESSLQEREEFSAETHSPTKIKIFKSESFRPGLYHLKIDFEKNGKVYNLEEDFTWGVLTINTNKSIYLPSGTAYLQMAVLDEGGHTICDADLVLEIIAPDKTKTIFKTEDQQETTSTLEAATTETTTIETQTTTDAPTPDAGGVGAGQATTTEATSTATSTEASAEAGPLQFEKIYRSSECRPNSVTYTPDYYTYYNVGESGKYQIKLTAITKNGTREITDQFEVREWVPFDVERIGPTRIYPSATYEMTLKIKANQGFTGEVVENLSESFQILDCQNCQVETGSLSNLKKLKWEVDWKSGENYELKYQFDAPDVSPYLYLLGPFTFESQVENGSLPIFQGARQWQIVADIPVLELKSNTPGPDFENVSIKQDVEENGIRAVIIERGGLMELWYAIPDENNPKAMNWFYLIGHSQIDDFSPLELKDKTIFWLDKNKQTIFGYAIDERSIFGKPVETEGKESHLEFQNKDSGLWRAVFDPINNKFYFVKSPAENQ